jgi:hypothetical protein
LLGDFQKIRLLKERNNRCFDALWNDPCADGGQDDDHEFVVASQFLYRNGQSLDWVILGDLRGMICHAAAQSAGADPIPKAPRRRQQFQAIQGGRSR